MIRIKRGLTLPIAGEPEQIIGDGPPVKTVALIGPDYMGMKPTMLVQEGDHVKLGQPVFEDKKTEGVVYTAPGCGKVTAINRGAKRVFQSIVIELDGDEEITFRDYGNADLSTLPREEVVEQLTQSGLWTVFRTRPFSKVPSPQSTPHSIFVTAIDTNPLAVDPNQIIQTSDNFFLYGLQILTRLTDGKIHVCHAPESQPPGKELPAVVHTKFDGPHPAGLVGTHIHFLDPVGPEKTVWHLNYQDLIDIGRLFVTGKIPTERVIALGGPAVENPRLIRTRIGASTAELTSDQLNSSLEEVRVVSGSVLSGRTAAGNFAFLGRHHLQVSALEEGTKREFLGWQGPGFNKFSVKRIFASALMGRSKKFEMTTSTGGSARAMVPIGSYEQVMPLDILPTHLLRALIVDDTVQAQALGCLELDEEDLALCTFVCPGKYEYAPILRRNLMTIEKEG